MRDARKSCSRRWAGNATTVSGGFAIRTELVVLGARYGSVARKRGRDARARDRSEREFRSRARARRKGGASRTRPRPEEEGVPLFARANCDHERVCPRKQMAGSFSVFGFFRLRLQAVIAVFSMSVLEPCSTSTRTFVPFLATAFFYSASWARLEDAARRVIDALFLSLLAHLLSAEIAPLRSARRQAPRGYPPGRRASPLGGHGVAPRWMARASRALLRRPGPASRRTSGRASRCPSAWAGSSRGTDAGP